MKKAAVFDVAEDFKAGLVKAGYVDARWRGWLRTSADDLMTFEEVWCAYQTNHLPTLSEAARVLKLFRCRRFFGPLFHIRMSEFNPQVIFEFIRYSKGRVSATSSRRFNFDKELKDLRAIFNWYQDTFNFKFANPIRPIHFKLAIIKNIRAKNRQITVEQLNQFVEKLPDFYRDLALLQFFCGARIGEIAGLQWENIDLAKRVLKIQDVLVWIQGEPKLKACPKNGLSREVYINDTMLKILSRRVSERGNQNFVFHKKAEPLLYGNIRRNYNLAWKKADLTQFTGSHQLRYAAAQLSRKLIGSIDGAKAVTGHQSLVLAQKYSDYSSIEENRTAVEKMERAFLFARETALIRGQSAE